MAPQKKKGRGRPTEKPFKAFNFHCNADLYDWLNENRGRLSMTKFLNIIIRERAELW